MGETGLAPTRMDFDRKKGRVDVVWPGGEANRVQLEELRRLCPCAVCVGLREQQAQPEGLHMITEDETPSAEIQDVIQVGNYAVQIRWADGHDTGIYTYEYIRQLTLGAGGNR